MKRPIEYRLVKENIGLLGIACRKYKKDEHFLLRVLIVETDTLHNFVSSLITFHGLPMIEVTCFSEASIAPMVHLQCDKFSDLLNECLNVDKKSLGLL